LTETILAPAGVAAELHDVWYSYDGKRDILRGITFEVRRREFAAIMGPSGSGKTTTLKIVAGLLKPRSGKVVVNTTSRNRVGYVPQQLGLVKNLTALENTLVGSLARMHGISGTLGIFPKIAVDKAMELLEAMGLGDVAKAKAHSLSGGQRQRVAIARTLMQEPEIVLADEFVSDLDLVKASEVMSLTRKISKERGLTFIMTMHDPPLVKKYADRVLILKDGAIASELSPSELDETLLRRHLS